MPPAMDIAGTANLLESLRNLRRRVKLLSVLYGVGVVLAAAVGLVLAVVGLDYLLGLPAEARAVVNLLTLGVLGYVLYRHVVRPALARLTLNDLAGQIENTFPQFDDSLRSTVNFMGTDVPGSAAMQQKTVQHAARLAGQVDLNQAVAVRPVWTSLSVGLAAVLGMVLLVALVDPALRDIAARRLFAGAAEWPKRVEFDVVGGAPTRVPAGQDVALQMKLTKGAVTKATIRHRFDNGPWQEQVVGVRDDGTFAARLPARLDATKETAKLQVKIEAGDDAKDLGAITVVPQLEVRTAIAVVTPPAYAGGKGEPTPALDRTLDVPVGSRVDVAFEFNRKLTTGKGVRVSPSDAARKLPDATWSFPRDGVAVATMTFGPTFVATDPAGFTVTATDVDGFENRSSPVVKVLVRADNKPAIVIENPAERTEDRTPEAYVPLRAVAEDDFGFKFVELRVKGASPTLASFDKTIPLQRDGKLEPGVAWELAKDSTSKVKRFLVGYQWELSKMGVALKPGDKIEYWLRGQDNFDLAGQYHDAVESEHHTIILIGKDELTARAEAKAAAARQLIDSVKKTLDANRVTAEEQAREAKERGKFDDAQRATAARLADQQASTAAQTKQVAKQLADLAQTLTENRAPQDGVKQAAEQAAQKLNNAADQPMKEAGNKLNEAKDQKSDPKASTPQQAQQADRAAQSMQKAAEQQQAASGQLEQAMKQLDAFGGLKTAIEKIQDIKTAQEKVAKEFKAAGKEMLGKKPEDLTPEQRKKLDDLVKDQDALAKATEKALSEMGEKADKMQKADPSAAKAMKDAAQAGQQQGIPQKQSNKKDDNGAAQQMEKNQQANAQQRHKEIDIGLEMILEKLKEAEDRKLAQLQKELAEVKALLDELVLRQATHNVDNVLIQDPSAKKFAELFKSESDRDALFAMANRQFKQVATYKADLQELQPAQEQTHRNAVAAAEKAKALQDPTPAGKINAAATKMEQAAVYLRKKQLAEAYAPLQVEALKALADAKKLIDEAKRKVDQEVNDRKEESIRQAYVKLLEEQKKIDGDTTDIDKNGKDADGNLKRDQGIKLAGLPGRQGKLSEEAKKLGERLASVNSVVYRWATKDIVTSMDEVKDDLAKPRTDAVVQAQQKRIERQLEAMIENLKKKQQDKRFAQRQNGGGGGGQPGQKPPPRMPTEAELKLLRDLQVGVNDTTKEVEQLIKDAGGKKDVQRLAGLGGRQGEMRNLLDQLIQEASKGQIKLGDEPDDKVQLPEEAEKGAVEEQELFADLLDKDKLDATTVEKAIKAAGDRMGRSRQRLAIKEDPGAVTQEIQKRIVLDMDNLIQLAQQQQQQGQPQPGQGQPGDPQPGDPQPGQGGPQQANNQGRQPGQQQPGGQQAAGESTLTQGGEAQQDLSRELEQKLAEWGVITDRARGPMRNGAGEQTAPKYQKYVADYYRELAKKASEQQK